MALDFEIGLVPPQYMDAIFNRGSLELTYTLIKSKEPEIALELTRILGNNPICSRQFRADNIHQESFYVSLNSRQVRCVVEVLLAIINTPYDDTTLGMNVVAKSLIEEWMKLATAMMRELNTDE
ncbi:hypothetical protein CJF42_12845 [Pseudoalteromonas sp. NBT06-2]|uniref:hypothetical protein n=1 Tax=Pseudoalteromonas sp. NBT06-2 TaxID=2025950 RepID=UPI000BA60F06|nr:hypothetical protein [Pseudoalteromonas sp. NBT06-2]PAJ74030.1 hypothetical protein CJF42_12845 [Pseudoalteromonas sp. NBT06-2]